MQLQSSLLNHNIHEVLGIIKKKRYTGKKRKRKEKITNSLNRTCTSCAGDYAIYAGIMQYVQGSRDICSRDHLYPRT